VVRDGALVAERPLERRVRWMRSVAGMIAHGLAGPWARRVATRTDLGEDSDSAGIDAGIDDGAAGGEIAPTRDVPRHRQ
jgi:hypothetical protein